MKRISRRVFDFLSPVFAGTNVSAPVTIVRFEPLEAFFRSIQAFVGQSGAVFSVSRNFSVTYDRSGIGQFYVPLIKASTPIAESINTSFAGRSVLCVGGQMDLYPAYRQIIEDADGRFLYFHGKNDISLTGLRKLLVQTDLVICPIDCVRHEAFWITKRFCEQFRKPCVMLDKSRVTTFYNGVRMLKKLQ
ncbi:DUF2325 domain-containing protein [Nitrosomonas sp.]|uniref:DUF2325 domain-containing protein n=1 Tax=Nitrosomonas sp. TaxID=42353 RepID=UPI00284E8D2E|nr:DUF2325 domain-containing protein [Nitrosomonas sp.]MDR4515383.1 DUF2325 domain-containing protein [Nitrosomonas sp.]